MQSSLDMDRMSSGATASSSGNSSNLSGSLFSFGGYGSLSGSGGSCAFPGPGVTAGGASGTQWVFPQHAGREVLAAYEFGAALGQGTFGVTSLVTCKRSAVLRACKSISKRRIVSHQCVEDMMREVAVLQHLSGHPGVVELVGVYEDRRAVHLVSAAARGPTPARQGLAGAGGSCHSCLRACLGEAGAGGGGRGWGGRAVAGGDGRRAPPSDPPSKGATGGVTTPPPARPRAHVRSELHGHCLGRAGVAAGQPKQPWRPEPPGKPHSSGGGARRGPPAAGRLGPALFRSCSCGRSPAPPCLTPLLAPDPPLPAPPRPVR
jgi:hypothetical protein